MMGSAKTIISHSSQALSSTSCSGVNKPTCITQFGESAMHAGDAAQR